MGGQLAVVVGAQYGSEGKGAVAAKLSADSDPAFPHVAIRVAGPNAGHTVIGPVQCDVAGPTREWKLRSVPVAAVSLPDADLVIAPGSEIDPAVLRAELAELDAAGYRATDRLLIDHQATILTSHNISAEQADQITERLGSTAKGIGSARSDRIWRHAPLASEVYDTVDTVAHTRGRLARGASVVIEGTQGFGLGLHAGEYPFCTSSDCRALDFLAMAGLNPWDVEVDDFMVYVVARTRPIRVAGNSGRLKDETSWEELGLKTERTTVTNKVRRVGEWDGELVRQALVANGAGMHTRLVITMLDQLFPHVAGLTDPEEVHSAEGVGDWVDATEVELRHPIFSVGTGPSTQVVL